MTTITALSLRGRWRESVLSRGRGSRRPRPCCCCTAFPRLAHVPGAHPALADRYHVVAPDLPGFGFTEAPDRSKIQVQLRPLAEVIERFTEVIGLRRYAIYVFDYGAPVGFGSRRHPERIAALISQNGNAYVEGLSEGWNPIQAYWQDPSPENRAALRGFLKPERRNGSIPMGCGRERLSPDAWTLDFRAPARPGNDEIQLDLFGDYQSNVALYPKFQEYFRTSRPPLPRGMGQERSVLPSGGAQAFRRDMPDAEIPSSTLAISRSRPTPTR